MSKYIGRRVDLGIGRETTRGAGVAPTFWVPKVDFSFDDKVSVVRDVGSMGSIADSDDAFVTTKYGQGTIKGEVRDKSVGLLLYAMLGSLSTSGPTDSAYTHAFTLSETNQHQSLAFTVVDPNTTELYKLCMLNSLELSVTLDNVVQFTAEFMGKRGVTSVATASYSAENKFTKKHLAFKVEANLAGLAAASALSLKSLALTTNKNVATDDVLGTVEPEDFLNQQLSIEGQIVLNYEDETWKGYMVNNTKRALEIVLSNTDVLIGASTRPSLTLRMPYVDFHTWEPNYALNEIVTQTVSFKGNADISGGNKIISTCSLVN